MNTIQEALSQLFFQNVKFITFSKILRKGGTVKSLERIPKKSLRKRKDICTREDTLGINVDIICICSCYYFCLVEYFKLGFSQSLRDGGDLSVFFTFTCTRETREY